MYFFGDCEFTTTDLTAPRPAIAVASRIIAAESLASSIRESSTAGSRAPGAAFRAEVISGYSAVEACRWMRPSLTTTAWDTPA